MVLLPPCCILFHAFPCIYTHQPSLLLIEGFYFTLMDSDKDLSKKNCYEHYFPLMCTLLMTAGFLF